MKAAHFLAHTIRLYHRSVEKEQAAVKRFREEVRDSFSAKNVTSILKKRLEERYAKEQLYGELVKLEDELLNVQGHHDSRAEHLRARISKIKKKIGKD